MSTRNARNSSTPTTQPGRYEEQGPGGYTPTPAVPSNLDTPAAAPVAPEAIMELTEVRVEAAKRTYRAGMQTSLAYVVTAFGPFVRITQGKTVRLMHPAGLVLTPKAGG